MELDMMPCYHVHFAADHREPLPPVDQLPSVDADSPGTAVEAMLQAGRGPQVQGLRWARVVLSVHDNGVPRQVMRFPIRAECTDAAIDWDLPGPEC
jgi:hypothetical protein